MESGFDDVEHVRTQIATRHRALCCGLDGLGECHARATSAPAIGDLPQVGGRRATILGQLLACRHV